MNMKQKIKKAIQDAGYNLTDVAIALDSKVQHISVYLSEAGKNPPITLRALLEFERAGLIDLQEILPEFLEEERQRVLTSLQHDPKEVLAERKRQRLAREAKQEANRFTLNETEEEAYKLHSEGKSFREIARVLGCNYQTAMNNVNRAGWKKLKQLEAQKE